MGGNGENGSKPLQKLHTVESLRARTLEERDRIYRNCLRHGGPAAEEVIGMLVATGEPYVKETRIAHGSPVYRAIELIINRTGNIELMLDSVAGGRPALEPLDPIIAAEVGDDYNGRNGTTILAGHLAGQAMYARGYEHNGDADLAGCVAKSAALFRKRKGAG